jgi:bacteriocin-like protein
MFKKSKKDVVITNAKIEKLSSKELNNVVGGAVNYNASKSNSGNITVDPNPANPNPVIPSPVTPIPLNPNTGGV